MKSSGQSIISHVLEISFVLVTSLILFVSHAVAQDPGTVKNDDGSTTTTVRDTTYGTYGVKSTTTDSKGIVTKEALKGNKHEDGTRDVLEKTETQYHEKGVKFVQKYIYRPVDSRTVLVSETLIVTDALGGFLGSSSYKYNEKEEIIEGGTIDVNPETGKKTTRKYNPKTGKNEDVPPNKIEPKNDARFKLFGGFSYMRAPDETAKNLIGFNASLFYDVTPHVAVGGDFSALFGSTTDTIGTIKFDTSLHRQTYLFGPQFNFYPNDKVKIFVHPLFGGVHDTTKTTIGTMSVGSSANAFAMDFGGGVDIRVNGQIAVRPIQVDYIPTHFGGAWQSNYRISTGLVIRFGGKK